MKMMKRNHVIIVTLPIIIYLVPTTKSNYVEEDDGKKAKYGFVHNVVVYGDKIFAAVLKRIDIYNKLVCIYK
jgi:hypothetical protein